MRVIPWDFVHNDPLATSLADQGNVVILGRAAAILAQHIEKSACVLLDPVFSVSTHTTFTQSRNAEVNISNPVLVHGFQ